MLTLLRLALVFVLMDIVNCRHLRVGAFNMRIFGKTKASSPDVMAVLVQIIRRYDIILLQEIRDSTNLLADHLLEECNSDLSYSERYDMVRSGRLGRTKSKEEYLFFYRPGAGLKVDAYYVHDDGRDAFEREPLIVWFSSQNTNLKRFALAGLHVDPDVAVQELNELYSVFADMSDIPDRMVLGDLNADCSYVGKTKWSQIPIKNDPEFTWAIPDGTDTTVALGTNCAYDRFIYTGSGWDDGIVPGSVRVYRFDEEMQPMDPQLAMKISDHYPIEFLLAEERWRSYDEF